MTQELAQILIEDAETLLNSLEGIRPKQSNLRNTAGPILRRWLVEKDIMKVQRALHPEKIKVEYFADGAATKNLKMGLCDCWVGGLSFNGTVVGYSSFRSPEHSNQAIMGLGPHLISDTMSAFLKQKVCHILGKSFTRKDVIYIHANHLGGAHHDPDKVTKSIEKTRLRETLGYEVDYKGNIQMLLGSSILDAKSDPNRRYKIYDLTDLVLLDTAMAFANGVLKARSLIQTLYQ